MKEATVVELLSQARMADVGNIFRDYLSMVAKEAIVSTILHEVEELCGGLYHPKTNSDFKRAGSAKGSVIFSNCRKEKIMRPRVRHRNQNREKKLISYLAARNGDEVNAAILRALKAGVSSRDMAGLFPGISSGTGKSSVSRRWAAEGLKAIEKLRGRELRGEEFFCLMLDGIVLSCGQTAIAALGVTADGRKMMLDFELGSSESREVCGRLLSRLQNRGFRNVKGTRLLVVLDGARPLKNAVMEKFRNPLIQRCLVHKERNIKACLSKRHWRELSRLFKNLRGAEGAEAGREKLDDIKNFLREKNKKALDSLEEAGEELIALHSVGAPSSLHTSLLSTNCIENAFNNVRRKIGGVYRWRAETDQAERWLAFAMLETEKGFRRIRGHKDIPSLLNVLLIPTDSTRPPQAHAPGEGGAPPENKLLDKKEEKKEIAT